MVAVFLGTGFEEIEAVAPVDILRRAGIDARFVGVDGAVVRGAHGICLSAEMTVEELRPEEVELLVVPGGLGGVRSIMASDAAKKAIRAIYERGGAAAAICAGPTVLYQLGVVGDRRIVCYPGMEEEMPGASFAGPLPAFTDGDLITGRGPGTALDFGFALLRYLRGQEAVQKLRADMACL